MNGSGKNDDNASMEYQLQMVMELMEKRSHGQASNAQVQEAVSNVLSGMVGTTPADASTSTPTSVTVTEESTQTPATTKRPPPSRPVILADTEDYDNDDDDEEPAAKKMRGTSSNGNENNCGEDAEDENDDNNDNNPFDEEAYRDHISLIPLGKQGAQMMTTFGDGPRPIPEALSAALMGTRHCLQVAIWDARALRRTTRQTFAQAQQVNRGSGSNLMNSQGVDPNLLFRAMSGHDKLSYDLKCGFDMEQLKSLFPEEIRAYTRWKDLKAEARYDENVTDDQEKAEKGKGNKDTSVVAAAAENDTTTTTDLLMGGHLQERAAHFDIRTERMKQDWYLKFANVRRGSFLPRGMRQKTETEIQWDQSLKPSSSSGERKSRPVAGIWESMPAVSVQFLHWLGFNPPMLPPPNHETTHALAFLGYDFLGKIVEKAIFLRASKQLKETDGESDIILELKRGEQLTLQDIEEALKHPDIRPAPLFGVDKKSQPPVGQLYFGPGFEERLELEMEELIAAGNGTGLSEEELRIRAEEAALFANLAKPPIVTDSVNYLMEQDNDLDTVLSNTIDDMAEQEINGAIPIFETNESP